MPPPLSLFVHCLFSALLCRRSYIFKRYKDRQIMCLEPVEIGHIAGIVQRLKYERRGRFGKNLGGGGYQVKVCKNVLAPAPSSPCTYTLLKIRDRRGSPNVDNAEGKDEMELLLFLLRFGGRKKLDFFLLCWTWAWLSVKNKRQGGGNL